MNGGILDDSLQQRFRFRTCEIDGFLAKFD